MSDAEVEEFLAGNATVHIATKGPGSRIHLVPLFYALLDGCIAVTGYARSQKVVNLERDNTLTALVETGDKYDELRGVQIVGKGEIIRDPLLVAKVMTQIRHRRAATGQEMATAEHGLSTKRVAVRVVPDVIHSWDHRKLRAPQRGLSNVPGE